MNNGFPQVAIRPATSDDWAAVSSLLEGAGLPVADLEEASLEDFLVAVDAARQVCGAVALQPFGEVGLLRSLVVAESGRSSGRGSRLVEALERRSIASGVAEIWLLTIDAAPWFAQRGFHTAMRGLAPNVIRETAEFSRLCPDSAVLMMKSLHR